MGDDMDKKNLSGGEIHFETLEEGKIALLTIDNPPMNVLTTPLLQKLWENLDKIDESETTRVVIITGKGRSFVAGADIKEMVEKTPIDAMRFSQLGQAVLRKIETLWQPVICAVNGYALGGGTELVMSCDIVVASKKAEFGQPEVKLGVTPGFGGTQRLARLIGRQRAKELIFTGSRVDAETAMRLGLVNHVVEPEELLPTAEKIAKTILENGPIAVALAKKAINQGLDTDLETGLAIEAEAFSMCFSTRDQKEGMKAFIEKRRPKFVNR